MRTRARSCEEEDLPCGRCESLPEELVSDIWENLESEISGGNRWGLTNIWFKVKRHRRGGSQWEREGGIKERQKHCWVWMGWKCVYLNTYKKNITVMVSGDKYHSTVSSKMIWTLKSHLLHIIWKLLSDHNKTCSTPQMTFLFCRHHQEHLFLDSSPSNNLPLFTIPSIFISDYVLF